MRWSLNYLDTQMGWMFLHWGPGGEGRGSSAQKEKPQEADRLRTGERQPREGTPPSQVTASHLSPDSTASHSQRWNSPKKSAVQPVERRVCCSDNRCLEPNHTVFKESSTKARGFQALLIPLYAVEQLRYQTRLSDALSMNESLRGWGGGFGWKRG